jgi:predicted  nucleic acid-binding Zn-ribbon protein
LDGELRHLKEEAYRLKIQTEEKLSVGKDLTNEIEQLQTKIDRAKDINLVLQKSIRRTKKTKSKLSEEVSEPFGVCFI